MNDYRQILEQDRFYHIYNRGINGTNLFYNKGNYEFFLHRYAEYVSPFVETYALCLLPNHFHLLVRVKEFNHVSSMEDLTGFKNLSGLKVHIRCNISQAFSNFFNSYSKAVNKQQQRHGALFERPFHRKLVTDTKYLANLVFYIHANPQLHGIANDFRMYPWSSYDKILKNTPTRLEKAQVLQWFSSPENFVAYHNREMDLEIIKDMMIE